MSWPASVSIDTITIANIFSTHSVLRNEDTSFNTDIDEGFIWLGQQKMSSSLSVGEC